MGTRSVRADLAAAASPGSAHTWEAQEFGQHPDAERAAKRVQKKGAGRWLARFLWLEPLWIMALAPLLLLPGRLLPLAFDPLLVVGLFAFWPLRLIGRHPLLTNTAMDGYLGLFLLWLPIPLWLSIDKAQSWQALGVNLLGLAAAMALIHWPPCRKRPELIVLGLSLTAALLMLAGPTLLQSAPEKLFATPTWQSGAAEQIDTLGESINPNVLAGALMLPIPLLAALALQRGKKTRAWGRLLCALVGLALLAATILTQSRGAYLGVAVGLWLVFILQWPRWRVAWLLGATAAIGAVYWIGPSYLLNQSAYEGSVNSFQGRVEVWSHAWAAVRDFPLTGLGPGLFGVLVPRLYPYQTWGATVDIPHAHNLWLQVTIDLGLPGLMAYGGIVVMTYVLLIQTMRRPGIQQAARALAIGALGAQTTILIHGLVDAVLWGTKLAWMSWMLPALAVLLTLQPAISRSTKRRRHRANRRTNEEVA